MWLCVCTHEMYLQFHINSAEHLILSIRPDTLSDCMRVNRFDAKVTRNRETLRVQSECASHLWAAHFQRFLRDHWSIISSIYFIWNLCKMPINECDDDIGFSTFPCIRLALTSSSSIAFVHRVAVYRNECTRSYAYRINEMTAQMPTKPLILSK